MSEDKGNIFARMLDKRDVVDFVKEIEKYQCLYDQNSYQYANKHLKRRTWLDIAKKYKSTVPDCKEKWRKIRIAYMRSLKLSKSGNPPSRPYYLADYLQFIYPGKKIDDNVPTTNSVPSPASSDASIKLEIDDYDHLADTNEHTDEHKQEIYSQKREECGRLQHDDQQGRNINVSSTNMDKFKEEENKVMQLERARDVCDWRNDSVYLETQKSCNDENNPRRMFLLSLLPDMESLTEQEMRTFRREVIALLDNIIASRNI